MEQDRKVPLQKLNSGGYTVPGAAQSGSTLEHLTDILKRNGLSPQLDHLYAACTDSEKGRHGIYYHATVSGPAPRGMSYFARSGLPLDNIPNGAGRSMLSRYQEEYKYGRFGIYQGDESAGHMHQVSNLSPSKH